MLNFRVDNKLAIVTGCNKGIGLSIAIALAESDNLFKGHPVGCIRPISSICYQINSYNPNKDGG